MHVEFALVVPALLLLLTGAIDFARLGMRYAEVQTVANAGVQYAMQSQGNAMNPAGIEATALADAISPTLTAAAGSYCQCSGGVTLACNLPCNDGDYAPLYVTVTARDTLQLLFPYPGIGQSREIAAASEGRVR
jgi:Flp pilus assembly protein TadG